MRGVTSRGEPRPLHVIISTRTPHAGSDGRTIDDVRAVVEFQPALPMRGVTRARAQARSGQRISTRTPHAGSDHRHQRRVHRRAHFNPHSPCGE